MDKGEATATAVTAIIAGKKSAFGGSLLFSSMVIFEDPAYLIIGLIGAFFSVLSEYYDLVKIKREKKQQGQECIASIWQNLIKAFILGLLFTIGSFLILNQVGNELVKHYTGMTIIVKILPSFWMIFTLWMSTKSIAIYNKFSLKVA